MWNHTIEIVIACGKGILVGLVLLATFGFISGCASTLDQVRAKGKADKVGSMTHDVAKILAKQPGVTGCKVIVEDEEGEVICW